MLYLSRDHTPSVVFYRTTRVDGAFTDLLVLRGRTDCSSTQSLLSGLAALTEWIHKVMQINKLTQYIVSPLLLR